MSLLGLYVDIPGDRWLLNQMSGYLEHWLLGSLRSTRKNKRPNSLQTNSGQYCVISGAWCWTKPYCGGLHCKKLLNLHAISCDQVKDFFAETLQSSTSRIENRVALAVALSSSPLRLHGHSRTQDSGAKGVSSRTQAYLNRKSWSPWLQALTSQEITSQLLSKMRSAHLQDQICFHFRLSSDTPRQGTKMLKHATISNSFAKCAYHEWDPALSCWSMDSILFPLVQSH